MLRLCARSATLTSIALILIAISTATFAQENRQPAGARELGLVLVEQYPSPVITVRSPGAEGNKYGFEGGNVVKLQGTYHMVTTEMTGDPLGVKTKLVDGSLRGVKTKLAHWSSNDRVHWKRVSTLYESSGEFAGQDPRAALWGPMFVYDEQAQRWDLVYVAYRAAPNTKTEWRLGYEGTIWRAVSRVKGPAGIDGPYTDVGVLLRPDKDSQPWEGLQGTDSFFPYRVGNVWYGFYGSANTEKLPVQHWRVGLAKAPALAGPWKRCAELNPVQLEKVYTENPIVTQIDDGTYLVVYDRATVSDVPTAIGYSLSGDGIHWSKGIGLNLQPKGKGHWANQINTPMGLIPEGNNTFTLFYTGEVGPPFSESVGFATLKLEHTLPAQGKK